MSSIITPNGQSPWFELIQTAHQQSDYQFSDELEHYLVLTLNAFMRKCDLLEESIALRLLNNYQENDPTANIEILRNTADECLIICGLFPERTTKHNLGLSYFIHSGQQAYHRCSNDDINPTKKNKSLFINLSENFVGLTDVLLRVR